MAHHGCPQIHGPSRGCFCSSPGRAVELVGRRRLCVVQCQLLMSGPRAAARHFEGPYLLLRLLHQAPLVCSPKANGFHDVKRSEGVGSLRQDRLGGAVYGS